MSEYRLNDRVAFDLPWDYTFSSSYDEEGNETYSIVNGYSVDDEGEESYEFKCNIRETVVERNAATEGKTLKECWVSAFENQENIRYLTLPGKPDTLLLTLGTGINIFGRIFRIVSLTMMVAVDDNSFLTMIASKGYDEEEPEQYLPVVEKMLTVAGSIVINGKASALKPVAAPAVFDALKPTFDGSAAVEVSMSIGAGKKATADNDKIRRVRPDESLYPHYLSIKENPASMLGANVVVNATGTEYEFKSLRKELAAAASDPDSGLAASFKETYQRIVDADHGGYSLDQRAWEMLPLFRVDPSVFDRKHDRECELAEGYMHRSYMMSALRSFAWTVSDWCRQKDIQPEDLLFEELKDIIMFISLQEWLNYDADTYCTGLCGCQDLHVYYVPDGTSDRDKHALLPDADHLAQMEALKKSFPNFREIPTQVHSLDALREDLAYIQPAIETIYDTLAEDRNPMEPLSGDVADILYAWCALALAAKDPFFTEDGPTNCWFTQKTGGTLTGKEKKQKSAAADMPKAKRAAAEDCEISISGTLEKYTGNEPAIILPEGINAVGTDAFLFNKTLKTVIFSGEVETVESDAFWGCEALEEVVLPASLRTICESAFRRCEALRMIVIPEGVREIESDAFTGCKQLKDIYLPESLWSIGYDAFCTFCDETVIHAPKGSDAVRYAKENGLQYDHKKPAARKGGTQKRKSSAAKKTPEAQPKNDIGFARENRAVLENGLSLPVPDGYFCCTEGTGLNTGWAYLVPEGTAADSNHIDAKPYSFAVTVSAGAHISFAPDRMEALKKVFLSKGYLAAEVPAESLVVSENCGFLYQNRTDAADATYNKVNGFLFAGEDVFQFHIYANYSSGIAQEPKTVAAFLENCREWMQRVQPAAAIHSEDVPDPVQQTSEEWDIDEGGVCRGCRGNGAEVIIPGHATRIARFKVSGAKKVIIPGTVETIEDNAFSGCTELEEVIMLDGVAVIEGGAFAECTNLKRVILPNTLRVLKSSAFENCESLQGIRIPDGVTELSNHVFSGCRSMMYAQLPEGLTGIGAFAFNECACLQSVDIPESVTQIGMYAFSGCSTLHSVKIPPQITVIERAVFQDCAGLIEVILPDKITSIGKSAFCGCSELLEINIPGSVTTIEESVFFGCKNIREVKLPVRLKGRLAEELFAYCSGLERVVVPVGITEIASNAFLFCEGLTDIHLPPFIREIHERAFLGVPGDTVFHVVKGSFPERFCRENDLTHDYTLDSELVKILQAIVKARKARAEQQQRDAEEKNQEQRNRYQQLAKAIEQQNAIIARNRGLFGTEAKNRKAAQERLAQLQAQLAKEFPKGKP